MTTVILILMNTLMITVTLMYTVMLTTTWKLLPNISKTFASKQDVLDKTPDPAVREMILRMEQIGCDTTFDRFDKQKPQCTFGIPDDTDDVKALAPAERQKVWQDLDIIPISAYNEVFDAYHRTGCGTDGD